MNQFAQKERIYGPYETIWVKKRVSNIDWKNWYSKQAFYCFLRKDGSGVMVGFAVVGGVPMDCFRMSNEELVQVDDYRKAKNIAPRPLKDINIGKAVITESSRRGLEKLREYIGKFTNKFMPDVKDDFEKEIKEETNGIGEPEVTILDEAEEEKERKDTLDQIPF